MTIMLEGFKIATEFAFDAGLASAEVGGLQKQVQGLSDTADRAIGSLSGLGLKFAMDFSGLAGGLMGFVGQAIGANDDFTKMQLKFATIIGANMEHLSGNIETFNDRMLTSKKIINDVVADARKFSLPAKELAAYTAQMSTVMISHGLVGKNFANARDMSRNLLKSAPVLGVQPYDVMNQMQNAMLGRANMQGQLMPRLMRETTAFKKDGGGIMTTKEFNALEMSKRVEILSKSLLMFSSDMKALQAQANTFTGTMNRLRGVFSGLGSILVRIGNVIWKAIGPVLNMAIQYLETNGLKIANQIARFIEPLIENPKKLLINLMQMRNLATDVGSAAKWTSSILMMSHLSHAISWLGKKASGTMIGNVFGQLAIQFPMLAKMGGWFVGVLSKIGVFFKSMLGAGILGTLGSLAAGFAGLTILFQAWSRASAMLKVGRATFWAQQLPVIAEMINKLKESFMRFMAPINDMIMGWAQIFFEIRGGTTFLSLFVDIMSWVVDGIEDLSKSFLRFYAHLTAFIAGMVSLVLNFADVVGKIFDAFKSGKFFSSGWIDDLKLGDNAKNVGNDYSDQYNSVMRKYATRFESDEKGSVGQTVTNIETQNNNINMNLKNQMQPDRIAFTVKDQLKKMSTNRTGQKGSPSLRMATA